MIHMHTDALLMGRHDANDERNRMHLVALREAKIATEYRESLAETATPAGSARRLAITSAATGSSVDLCASCA